MVVLQDPELKAAFQLLQITWNKDYQVGLWFPKRPTCYSREAGIRIDV